MRLGSSPRLKVRVYTRRAVPDSRRTWNCPFETNTIQAFWYGKASGIAHPESTAFRTNTPVYRVLRTNGPDSGCWCQQKYLKRLPFRHTVVILPNPSIYQRDSDRRCEYLLGSSASGPAFPDKPSKLYASRDLRQLKRFLGRRYFTGRSNYIPTVLPCDPALRVPCFGARHTRSPGAISNSPCVVVTEITRRLRQ